jgi:glycogen operon protein
VCYNGKHNEMNGEENRDGSDNNLSSSYGTEGDAPAGSPLDRVRTKQVKNFMATLLLSLGTPMFLGGDEFRRTQKGNNNAYCQNNEVSWFDWKLAEENSALYEFFARLIHFRFTHPALLRPEFYTGRDASYNAMPDITWFDERGKAPDWNHQRKILALRIDGSQASMESDRDSHDLYLIFNAGETDRIFSLAPPRAGLLWHRLIDTALDAPEDFMEEEKASLLRPQNFYYVSGQSLVLLMAKS